MGEHRLDVARVAGSIPAVPIHEPHSFWGAAFLWCDMKYRSDVDGLRAVAVLPVILYHAGISAFSGGYVGVDIFFVISGYLITGIISAEMAEGSFTISNFYVRRIKRIFPALYFMLAVSAVIAVFTLLPKHLENYGKSIIAAVFFGSNIFFWRQSGYFETAAEEKPLLHTWSLGVEEQFYIFFPLFLFWLYKRRMDIRKSILIVFSVSFVLSVFLTPKFPESSFYLLPARAWELMLGALIALGVRPKGAGRLTLNTMSVVGLLLICFSIFHYDRYTLFPGYAAAVPCFGAGLVIASGCAGDTLAGRLLGLRPVVFVGLLSYSLYLWHWVFISLRNYYKNLVTDSFVVSDWFIILITFIFSIISYYAVERPFRRMKFTGDRRFFAKSAVFMLIFTFIGSVFYFSEGFPSRVSDEVNRITFIENSRFRNLTCFSSDPATATYEKMCRVGDGGKKPEFLLWGDSHALSLTDGIDMMAKREGFSGLFAGKSTCPPTPLVRVTNNGATSNCRQYNDNVIKTLKEHPEIKTVIMAGAWGAYTDEDNGIVLEDVSKKGLKKTNRQTFHDSLIRTVKSLEKSGINVYVVTDVPRTPFDASSELGKQQFFKSVFPDAVNEVQAYVPFADYMDYNSFFFDVMKEAEEKTSVKLISIHEVICGSSRCRLSEEGRVLYLDDNHLSRFGSEYAVGKYWQSFRSALSR